MAAVNQLQPLSEQHSMQERIYQELRRALVQGMFDSGERVYEAEIAQQLGVSRVPVREAVRRLQQDGLLQVRGRGGVYVASISTEEVDEVYRLRAAVEGVAAGLAAERASPEQLDQIGALIERMEAERGGRASTPVPVQAVGDAGQASADERVVNVADEFHRAIHAAAKCDRVYQVLEPLYAQLMRFRRITLGIPGRAHDANNGHRQVYLALRRGDPEAAELVMREHIDSARRVLLAHLAKQR
jgi:DNA-binding GntR family transcriptional regulator